MTVTYNTFSPPLRPTSTAPKYKARVKKNDFDDGYCQIITDGLRPWRIESMELSWDYVKFADAVTIETFFKEQAGKPFYWTLPNEQTPRVFLCTELSPSYASGKCSLSASLEEVFV